MENRHLSSFTKPKLYVNKLALYLLGFALLVLVVSFGTYTYQTRLELDRVAKENKVLKDPAKSAEVQQQQAQEVIVKLGKILKADETGLEGKQPAVATITDVEKLKTSQPEFYKNAQPEDYLIVYPTRAIIYREKDNQIINIAPIIQAPASSSSESSTQSSSSSVKKN